MKQGNTDVLMWSKFNEERMNLYVLSIQFFGDAGLPIHFWNKSLSPWVQKNLSLRFRLCLCCEKLTIRRWKRERQKAEQAKWGGGGGRGSDFCFYSLLCFRGSWRLRSAQPGEEHIFVVCRVFLLNAFPSDHACHWKMFSDSSNNPEKSKLVAPFFRGPFPFGGGRVKGWLYSSTFEFLFALWACGGCLNRGQSPSLILSVCVHGDLFIYGT